MIENPEITTTEAQPAAVIHVTVPRNQIEEVMGPAIQEVLAAAIDQGVGPRGPVFAHHLRLSAEEFDFEVGVPVDGPVTAVGRVKPGELPAATVARAVYRGPYEGLHDAWKEFGDRMKEEFGDREDFGTLQPGPTLWERYVVGPESSPDPSDWRTELNQPLVEA